MDFPSDGELLGILLLLSHARCTLVFGLCAFPYLLHTIADGIPPLLIYLLSLMEHNIFVNKIGITKKQSPRADSNCRQTLTRRTLYQLSYAGKKEPRRSWEGAEAEIIATAGFEPATSKL